MSQEASTLPVIDIDLENDLLVDDSGLEQVQIPMVALVTSTAKGDAV